MTQPYVGEIRMFAGSFAPVDWALCQGQLMSIAAYDTLFSLIGTTYGGDGQMTFALPDLQGRIPSHVGAASGGVPLQLGETSGAETVLLTVGQIPVHSHTPTAAATPITSSASNTVFSAWPDSPFGDPNGPLGTVPMAGGVMEPAGGSQPHENLSPYLVVNFIISLVGVVYPSAT